MYNGWDMITCKGPLQLLPRFLVFALRNIIYRLEQSGMWKTNDYYILLTAPHGSLSLFFLIWSRYYLGAHSEIEKQSMAESKSIIIDNIKVSVEEGLSDRYYLVVVRVGNNELIKWDSETKERLFRAPWATAGYEVELLKNPERK